MVNSFSCVIADDETAILENLKCAPLWEKFGISIIAECNNGKLAYETIQRLKPDFAIIDIRMPLMTGLEVLKQCHENGLSTHILIMSGFDDFSYAKQALKYGAKAYLLKPIDFSELTDELQRLLLSLESERKAINQALSPASFFNDLIEGRIIDSSIINHMLPSLETKLTNTSCYVIILYFIKKLSDDQYKVVLPILDAKLGIIRHKVWFRDSKSVVGILNTDDKTPFEVVTTLLESFEPKIYENTIAGIGEVVPELHHSSHSYEKAQAALSYRIYNCRQKIFSTQNICTVAPPENQNPLNKVDMVKEIIQLDKEGITRGIREFLSALLYVPAPNPNYLYSLCNVFIANTNAALAPLLPPDAVSSVVKEIPLANSIEEIRLCLESYFFSVCDYISRVYGQGKAELLLEEARGSFKEEDALIRTAKIYIRENIDRNIHISDIADSVHLSSSYFAIYFKTKTGITLRDYLLREKMEWACKMLLKRSVSIDVISDTLGYSDYHAFSRAFKKIYGKSPSAIRACTHE